MSPMTHPLVTPLLAGLGPTELLIIVAVIVLLFGAKKLPELARGSGRALRIFKAETKGLLEDDDDDDCEDARAAADRRAEPRGRVRGPRLAAHSLTSEQHSCVRHRCSRAVPWTAP